jgi:uncharacterized membrane protein
VKIDWKRKLTSRKFWMAVIGFVTALMIYRGASEAEAERVACLIMAGASVIAYIIGEGLADSSPYYIEPSEETDPVEEEQQ